MSKLLIIKSSLIITLLASLTLLTAPAMAFTDFNDKPVTLESLTGKGKWSVFEIWQSDCGVCRRTIHYLSDFSMEYPSANVYGISIDGKSGKPDAQAFISEHQLDFPNLLSDVSEVRKLLLDKAGEELLGTPTFMVFNPQGKLLAVQPGPVTPAELLSFIKKEEAASPTVASK